IPQGPGRAGPWPPWSGCARVSAAARGGGAAGEAGLGLAAGLGSAGRALQVREALGSCFSPTSVSGSQRKPQAAPCLNEEVPQLPVMAAHVFVPIDPQCIEQNPFKQKQHPTPWPQEEGRGDHQVFFPLGPSRYRDPLGFEGRVVKPPAAESQCPCARDCGTDNLKAVASVAGALLLCPCLIYGAYIFLPFDAPLLPTTSARLVYTLRCTAFATFPIVLGMIVSGISRLCSSALEPFGELHREVEIHRTYVSQSVHLFILYFFNMAVLATYLPQELLKLIPLLTGLFAISRLIFWVSYAIGRSFRAFGFSMTFLPLLAMLIWNLYGLFILEPESLLSVATPGSLMSDVLSSQS
uniref:Transmembrane protein 79 n=1 Tax=Catharus ustulatus TaxID=91951 RepID=A0A8C3V135_CATUS